MGVAIPLPAGTTLRATADPSVEFEPHRALLGEVICQRNLMIDVAAGGSQINDVDDYYRARRRRIQASLKARQIEDPNPFEDLWAWYRKWRDDLGGYKERRRFIRRLYGPLIDELVGSPPELVPPREPTGWERVDRALEKARSQLAIAKGEEDYQSIGLLCREVLISLGQAVFDPSRHATTDGVEPSTTDVKRMLEGYIASVTRGASSETIRRHARATLALALELQHKRTAEARLAALCTEATASTVNVIAILAGATRSPRW